MRSRTRNQMRCSWLSRGVAPLTLAFLCLLIAALILPMVSVLAQGSTWDLYGQGMFGDAPAGPPELPSAYWGDALVGGQNVQQGLRTTAWIDGELVAETTVGSYSGQSVYSLDIAAAAAGRPGGSEGATVAFKVGSTPADQTTTWSAGGVQEVNLTIPAFATHVPVQELWTDEEVFRHSSQSACPRLTADVDGDGSADVVAFDPDLGVQVGLSTGSGFGPAMTWSTEDVFKHGDLNTYPLQLADVNGDGMSDAVCFHPTDGVRVALSTGASFASSEVWYTGGPFPKDDDDMFPRRLGDVNGDGMADAVCFHPRFGVAVALSNGTSFEVHEWWGQWRVLMRDSWTQDPRFVADVNGDGLADIVTLDSKVLTMVALSTGESFEKPVRWSWAYCLIGKNKSMETHPRLLDDMNGDGRADIAVFRPYNGFWVLLSDGTSFAGPTKWHDSFGWYGYDKSPRCLGDVNGDGRYDAIGFRSNMGAWVGLCQAE